MMELLSLFTRKGWVNDSIPICTDTRYLKPGCIFFALKGATFDGNNYAQQALEQGAAAVVVDNPKCVPDADERYILVADVLKELQLLARDWRRRLAIPIIGITGTNGKTTTKELMAAVLRTKYNLYATHGNLNNAIGVPLTLLQLSKEHQLAIVEMGASHPGDIKELVEIAEPNYGLITNVGQAHLQGFGSFEGVQRTKQELYDYLVAHKGIVFRNADNLFLEQMLMRAKGQSSAKEVLYHTGTMPEGTHLVGNYNAENIAAALCVGEYFGVNRQDALKAVCAYVPANDRSMALQTDDNQLVVDAYNANPTSMKAALESFAEIDFPLEQKVVILGDMLELGAESLHLHQDIVNCLEQQGIKTAFLIGEEFAKTNNPYITFPTTDQLKDYLAAHLLRNKLILLKGSHRMHLETLKDVL